MKEELEDLLEEYSKDIDENDEEGRAKIDVIRELLQDKDWEYELNQNGENIGFINELLIYEYSTGIEKLTGGRVNYRDVATKLTSIIGKLRFGKWQEQDSNVKYDGMSVTDEEYRQTVGRSFGAQSIDYIDEDNNFKMAVIAYDKNEGDGIDFSNINDIRHTFFHEWTHIMELDRVKANEETEVTIDGRVFKNNEKKANGEIWGTGLVTREYGENAEKYAGGTDCNGNKRIMHNQITEGMVELIARKIMSELIGKENLSKAIDEERYVPNIKVAQILMNTFGEEELISMFTSNSQELIKKLENIKIEDRDALHFISDFVNDKRHEGVIPEYSPETELYNEVKDMNLSPIQLQEFIKNDERVKRVLTESQVMYDSLQGKIEDGIANLSETKENDDVIKYFHDQKSDEFFEDVESGLVSVPLTKKLGKETMGEQKDVITLDEIQNVKKIEKEKLKEELTSEKEIKE